MGIYYIAILMIAWGLAVLEYWDCGMGKVLLERLLTFIIRIVADCVVLSCQTVMKYMRAINFDIYCFFRHYL